MKRKSLVHNLTPVLLISLPAVAHAQFLKADYPNAAFNTAGGNAVQGVFNAATIFTEGAQQYRLSVYPVVNPNLPDGRRNPTAGPASINSPNFQNKLSATFASWVFNYTDSANNNADYALSNNSVSVKSYSTCVSPANGQNATAVGADLYLSYDPHQGNPVKNNKLHWIQVLNTNWGIDGQAGTSDNKVDNGGNVNNPYYDTGFDATSDYFFDRPTRLPQSAQYGLGNYNFAQNGPIFWTAEVFLVQEVGDVLDNQQNVVGHEVNVYDGVRWGWKIEAVPEPAFYQLGVLLTCGVVVASASRRRRPTSGLPAR